MMRQRRLAYYVGVGGAVLVVLVSLGIGFSPLKAPATQSTTKAWVDDDPTCGGNSPCFQTIQAAVDALPTGTVYIRPGLYREHVHITKDVELEGAGRELVRLEAPDPTKPVILVKGTYLSGLSGLGIFGGLVGILVEDAQVFAIEYNRIAGYVEAGIRLVRSQISDSGGIYSNELPDQRAYFGQAGIEIGGGSFAKIEANIIRSYVKIDGKDSDIIIAGNILQSVVVQQGKASISNNHFMTSVPFGGLPGVFIMGADASASIIANQIQGYPVGIFLLAGKAYIEGNLISLNLNGIVIGDPTRPTPKPPQFAIVRNRLMANREWGLVIYQGQGIETPLAPPGPRAQIHNNVISENGDASSLSSGGVEFWPRVRLNFSNNWVVNNMSGICPYFDYGDNPIDPEALTGKDNEIRDNIDDLCKRRTNANYPWPPGFRKP